MLEACEFGCRGAAIAAHVWRRARSDATLSLAFERGANRPIGWRTRCLVLRVTREPKVGTMTATNLVERTTNGKDAATTTARLSLAELLKRSMEEDPTTEEPVSDQWDDDEGSSGG